MNYLVHAFLSDPEPLCRLGNLAGDFVKGPLDDRWHPDILRGLRQHRRVDTFAQNHSAFRRSKRRIDPRFGHCRGILVDVFYDHLLALHWERYSPPSLPEFAAGIYRAIETHLPLLPTGFRAVTPRLIRHDWLVSYREPAAVERALARVAGRLRHPGPLAEGLAELTALRDALATDCQEFLAAAREHLATRPHP